MTAYKFTAHRQLKDLLNNAEGVQKNDIHSYAGGHLNESLLYKPPSTWASAKWTAGKDKPPIVLVEKSKKIPHPPHNEAESKMKDTLYDFSIGTSGSVPVFVGQKTKSPRLRYSPAFTNETDRPQSTKRHPSAASRKSVYSELQDGILVEEMKAEELMLPSPRVSAPFRRPSPLLEKEEEEEEQEDYDVPESVTSDLDDIQEAKEKFFAYRHKFLPTHHIGVTKKDQFKKMKQIESSVIRKQDSSEQKVLSGVKAVEHLTNQLQEELESLNFLEAGPNFHRLQVFSNVLDDLISETPTFSYVLQCIKAEYDNYISNLLDTQTPQHSRMLREQVEQMSKHGSTRPYELRDAKNRVQQLEDKAEKALVANDLLRNSLVEENEWLKNMPANLPEPPKAINHGHREEAKAELSDEIEHVKALILEKLDELTSLRTKLREEHVPLTVCTHLEQCIKETEIEVQKLLKQNEYLERSIAEMEADLKDAIQDADTSERDARRIWRKVNSRKGIPHMNYDKDGHVESDEDDDDESKWNWYIS